MTKDEQSLINLLHNLRVTFKRAAESHEDLHFSRQICREFPTPLSKIIAWIERLDKELTEVKAILGDATSDSTMYAHGLAEGRKESAEHIASLRQDLLTLRIRLIHEGKTNDLNNVGN